MIGPSGSGKSTFLRCINLLETPTKGSIVVDGKEITDKKADINKLRQHIGMVFQHFNLFPSFDRRKEHHVGPCGFETDVKRTGTRSCFGIAGPCWIKK